MPAGLSVPSELLDYGAVAVSAGVQWVPVSVSAVLLQMATAAKTSVPRMLARLRLSLKRNVGHRVRAAEAELAGWARYDALRALVVLAAEPPRQTFRPERLQPRWLE